MTAIHLSLPDSTEQKLKNLISEIVAKLGNGATVGVSRKADRVQPGEIQHYGICILAIGDGFKVEWYDNSNKLAPKLLQTIEWNGKDAYSVKMIGEGKPERLETIFTIIKAKNERNCFKQGKAPSALILQILEEVELPSFPEPSPDIVPPIGNNDPADIFKFKD